MGFKDKGFKKKGLKKDKGKLKNKLQGQSPSDTYEKSKGVLSRLLNLMGVDVGPDPLQDLLDIAGKRTDTATEVVGDASSVLNSNVENIMTEKDNVYAAKAGVTDARMGVRGAAAENEADRWKSILRNFIKIEEVTYKRIVLLGKAQEIPPQDDTFHCSSLALPCSTQFFWM